VQSEIAAVRKSFINCRIGGRGTIFGNFTDTASDLHITGHGSFSGRYARSSWQDAAASGNPSKDEVCDDCHDLPPFAS